MSAPIALLLIRVLQGLALGGEYGGAAVYVAEHVPDEKRGFYTSFIQITATLGLFVSLAVILIVQNSMSREAFGAWGWRIPFLISIFLVVISLYIRLRMKESPIFQHIKSTGMTSAKPLKEAFTQWDNLKRVLISLFGATAGQGVVWYTGQFYALFYLQTVLKVNGTTANYIVATALLLAMPFFVLFGALSDRIGRKRIMMAGCLLAAISYIPIYKAMQEAAGSNVVSCRFAEKSCDGRNIADPTGGHRRNARERSVAVYKPLGFHRQCRSAQAVSPGVHSGDLCNDGLRTDRRLPGRSVSRQDPIHRAVASLSHRERSLWRTAATHRTVRRCADRQYLRGSVLPHRRCVHHIRGWIAASEGNASREDLEGSWSR